MSELITFDEQQKIFHLQNQTISYIFSIEEYGLLSHLYFGKRVSNYHGQLRYPRFDRGFSGNLPGGNDRRYSADTLPREMSATGDSDYRTPATTIFQEDGTPATHFRYRSHAITPGKPQLDGLPQSYVVDSAEAATLTVTIYDAFSQIELALQYTIYRDRPVVTRSIKVQNPTNKAVQIEKIASIQLDFAQGELDVISFPGAHVHERQLQRETLTFGQKRFASRRGATSHQMNNSLFLAAPTATEDQGEAYGFNLVYSGSHALELEKDQLGQVRLLMGINEDQFSWKLAAGDSFQTPEVLLAYSDEGFNDLSHTFHDLIRNRIVRGSHQRSERPILVNNWEATYFDFDEEKLKPIVDEAQQLGIEMFVLDDGWFGKRNDDTTSLGDWVVDTQKFPHGLGHFADYVHQKGLQFGIWFEPEMISLDSDLYRKHPDYALALPHRAPSPSRSQYVLDLGRSDVRENLFQQLTAILDEGYIDYIKWDMNRHISDVYSAHLPADRQGETLHRYMLGLYDLLERLVTRYPAILWESCSGGGGRFDTGFAYYMPQTWTSDNTDAVARLGIQYGTSYLYPPSLFTSHVSAVPNHQTGRETSLAMRGAVAMSSVFGYELDLTALHADEKSEIQQQIATYKEIRPLVQYGTFTRLKNPFTSNHCAWQFVDDTQDTCLVYVYQLLSEARPVFQRTRLQGLDPKKQYQNTETLEIFGGDELMNLGFYHEVQQADFTAQALYFKAVPASTD